MFSEIRSLLMADALKSTVLYSDKTVKIILELFMIPLRILGVTIQEAVKVDSVL